jgi:hypothetical protein
MKNVSRDIILNNGTEQKRRKDARWSYGTAREETKLLGGNRRTLSSTGR